jgi:hypothetical protein
VLFYFFKNSQNTLIITTLASTIANNSNGNKYSLKSLYITPSDL